MNFFCHIVAVVAPIKATIDARIPNIGIDFPISNPITKAVPNNPNNIPIHCVKVTFSFNIGPLKILLKQVAIQQLKQRELLIIRHCMKKKHHQDKNNEIKFQ